jgi:hypothetical protein
MRNSAFILSFLVTTFWVNAQTDLAENLKKKYAFSKGFATSVNINVAVPGLTIPPKDIHVYYEKGKKPQIKGKGLLLLPKKGFVNQFSDLLSIPAHWIFIEDTGGIIHYKLVAMDAKADWVTADLKITKANLQIQEIDLNTKESGVFQIKHRYEKGVFPVYTEINFWTKKLNIPLKFLGKSNLHSVKDIDGKVKGKIVLKYSNFRIL